MGNTIVVASNSGTYASVDKTVHALKTIGAAHAAIHHEESFTCNTSTARGSEDAQIVRFQTPVSNTECHMLFRASASLEFKLDIYEATTLTHASNNAIVIRNRNRNSKEATKSIACHTPGGSGNGTLIFSETLGAGKNSSGKSRGDTEYILKRNTPYAIVLTSNKASNTVNLELDWYEESTTTYTTTTTTTSTTTTTTTTSTAAA